MNLFPPLFSVLPRSRASAALLAAALVMASVATTLVAAVPLYSDAIVEAGLRSTLADAAPAESGFEVSFRADAAEWESTVASLDRLADDHLPGERDDLVLARSDTFNLPSSDPGWITSVGTTRGAAYRDVSPAVPVGDGRVGARLHTAAADLLDLTQGDSTTLTRRGAPPIEITVVALVEPINRFDKIWWDQPLSRDGVSANGSFTEIGPFLVDPATFSSLGGTMNLSWRVIPTGITTADVADLRDGVAGIGIAIGDRLEPAALTVDTTMPELLAATDTAIGATAAVIAAILLQLVGVALYGVGMSAAVLVGSRAVETSMLRSRGATPHQLAAMAATEALLIAVPAVASGPWLGSEVVELLERWGPVSGTGLDLQPAPSITAWAASAVIGVAVVAIVTWPAVRSAQGFASSQATRSRPVGPVALRRSGVDLVVVALAGVGLWRLAASSASTTDLSGRLGTDPVLVLAPALGVIAASLLTLRAIALTAGLAERVTSRLGALPVALAGWEIARRPGRTARTSVLIVLAVTVGTFAAVHGASWQQSLRDQADASVSADVVITPDPRPAATIGQRYVPQAYARLAGVESVVPIDRPTASIAALPGPVPVVLTDAAALEDTLRLRSDLYGDAVDPVDFARLHTPVDLGAVDLGDPTGDLSVPFRLDVSPGTATGTIRTSFTLLDRTGTPVRVDGGRIPLTSGEGTLTLAITDDTVAGQSLAVDGPLRLVTIDLSFPSVQDVPFTEEPLPSATYQLDLGPIGTGVDDVDLDADWRIGSASLGNALTLPSNGVQGVGSGALRLRVDSGSTTRASGTYDITVDTGDIGGGDGGEIPVFVTPGFLASTSLDVGDRVVARISGGTTDLRVAGVVPVVPFDVTSDVAFVADWETVILDRYARTRRVDTPDAWALSVDETTADELERLVSGPPFDSADFVDRRQEARSIGREPVTVGLAGSLSLALVASLVIAAIGLLLTAVVGGRERRPAFAVLRAMGTRPGELRRWLLFETLPLVGFSAGAGLAAGVLLARLALPSLGVAVDGSRSIPTPRLVVPWSTLSAIVAVAIAAGMALPIVTARLLRRHRTTDELRIGDTT